MLALAKASVVTGQYGFEESGTAMASRGVVRDTTAGRRWLRLSGDVTLVPCSVRVVKAAERTVEEYGNMSCLHSSGQSHVVAFDRLTSVGIGTC